MRKLLAANWKMNLGPREAGAVASKIRELCSESPAEVVVCPPFVSLPVVAQTLDGSGIAVGAQDVFWASAGAFTGQVSAPMLRQAGASYCIVGHSETRGRFGKLETPIETLGYFSENEKTLALKLGALRAEGITPILCVGETREERDRGETEQVVLAQLVALDGLQSCDLAVAYEPVWAIGTGLTCPADQAEAACSLIKMELGRRGLAGTRVLYGGSMKGANSGELLAMPSIDGGLIGGASLDPEEFAKIVRSAP